MYKNQLQELAQRSCFNLPSYSCIREGPDHAPRFKSTVNFNGETFESPTFCSTLRQAEHAAAEVALSTLANRGPSRALAARVLDETGVYKNLLQETAHRAGLNLPVYTTVRSGPGHVPVFSCTVELAGLSFTGEHAKTKKQAQKNAALAAWSTLKQLDQRGASSSTSPSSPLEYEVSEEQEQVVIARLLASLRPEESNKSMQSDSQRGAERFTCNSMGPIPQASSLYPLLYETWAYSGFSTEMEMYRMWQQAQLPQLQGRVLPLPALPAPLPNPQVLPFMHSMFQPNHLYFMARGQARIPVGPAVTFTASSPSFHLSNHSIPAPTRSMVTIQEIQEEKSEGSSTFCPSEISKSTVLDGRKKESVIPGKGQEDDKQKSGGTHAKPEDAGHPERNPSRQATLFPDYNTHVDSGFQAIEFKLQNTREYSPSHLRGHFSQRGSFHEVSEPPFSTASPIRVRTASPASFMEPRPQNFANQTAVRPKFRPGVRPYSARPRMEFGVPSRFMAPAVQIRSVVPVCSAPPAREMPSSSHERQSSDSEKKTTGQEGMLAASSELNKLQL